MKDFPTLGNPQQSPLVRKESKTSQRTHQQLLLILLILFAVSFFFVFQRVEYLSTERHIRALLSERRQLNEEILPIQLEMQYRTRMEAVQQQAANKLIMSTPRPNQLIQLDRPAPEGSAIETPME